MVREKEQQTKGEEVANSLSHGVVAVIAVVGFVFLVFLGVKSNKEWSLLSALFYGVNLVLMYTISSVYHGLKHKKAKRIFKVLDHCSIFLFIAGTYTPVVLVVFGGVLGWSFFIVQWSIAIIGVVLKIFYTGRFNLLSTLLYALMGWSIVIKVNLLKALLPEIPFLLLVAGGVSYTIGIIFYVIDTRIRYSHFIWHLFVILGSVFHYALMVMHVLQ